MITFIHGDDIVSSRNYLMDVKSNVKTQTFFADSEEPHLLMQLLQGDNLFNDRKSLIIENVFSKKSANNLKILEDKIKLIKSLDIYIWESKEISKSQLSSLGPSSNKLFKIPQKVFSFLDSIAPNSKNNVVLFRDVLSTTEEEFIFFMLIRQFRLMLNLIDDQFQTDEVKRLAPWQKSKLQNQSRKFGTEDLKIAYKKLYRIESKVKVGALNMPLSHAIDIFLLDL